MKNKILRVIVSISIIFIIAISFFMGRFTAHFNDNLCYSDLLNTITLELEHSDAKEIDILQQKLHALPLYGYESNCNEIHNTFSKK